MKYALLKDGAFVEYKFFDELPEVATHKGYSLLPVVEEDLNWAVTEYVDVTVQKIIEPTRYVVRRTVSDKPQAEIDAIVAQQKQTYADILTQDNMSLYKALGAVMFDLVNEVRALKSQAPITKAQFKDYVKGKL